MTFRKAFASLVASLSLLALGGCSEPQPGTVLDEAMRVGRTAESFPAAAEDYFADMDGGYKRDTDPSVKLNVNEARGRNSWIVWTGGNDRFWDYMSNNTFGAFDLLKIMSSNPRIGFCIGPDKKLNDVSEYSEFSEALCKQNGLNLVHAEPQQSLLLVWADQRAVLRAGDRSRRIRPLARPPQEGLPGRSVR